MCVCVFDCLNLKLIPNAIALSFNFCREPFFPPKPSQIEFLDCAAKVNLVPPPAVQQFATIDILQAVLWLLLQCNDLNIAAISF